MPRPGDSHIGHSKHRKAFGSKYHKSSLTIYLTGKQANQMRVETEELHKRQKSKMYSTVKELFNMMPLDTKG